MDNLDTVTVHIPSMRDRAVPVVMVVLGAALVVLALGELPWFAVANGRDASMQISVFTGLELCERVSTPVALAMFAFAIVVARYLRSIIYFAFALVRGYPSVKRGLFSSRFVVAWRTPRRARVWTAMLAVATLAVLVIVPWTVNGGAEVQALGLHVGRAYGAYVALVGIALLIAAVQQVVGDPALAATQRWADAPAAEGEVAPAAPTAKARPMLAKVPLAAPPTAISGDPFRGGAGAAPLDLADKLVRPSATAIAVPRAASADPSAEQPRFLR